MAQNIEIKARARNFKAQLERAKSFCGNNLQELQQEDYFFNCPNGRLKLRIEAHRKDGQLITYHRPDQAGPKSSHYQIYYSPQPQLLKQVLSDALGLGPVVKKRRLLLLAGQTRIHFDQVEGLGEFIELEVVLRPNQDPAAGRGIANTLMQHLGIEPQDLLEGAYAELK